MRRLGLAWQLTLGMVLLAGCAEPAPDVVVDTPAGYVKATGDEAMIVVSFADVAAGEMPPNFAALLTGTGLPVVWQVREDEGVKVVKQLSADDRKGRYPLLVYEPFSAARVAASVMVKPESGALAAGLAVGVGDEKTYTAVLVDGRANRVRVVEVEDGKAREVAGVDARVERGIYHTLQVTWREAVMIVSLNGREVLRREADLPGAGRVGLVTAEDTVAAFDGLRMVKLGE